MVDNGGYLEFGGRSSMGLRCYTILHVTDIEAVMEQEDMLMKRGAKYVVCTRSGQTYPLAQEDHQKLIECWQNKSEVVNGLSVNGH